MKKFDLKKALENVNSIEVIALPSLKVKTISYFENAVDGYRVVVYYENGKASFHHDDGKLCCGWHTSHLVTKSEKKEGWINLYNGSENGDRKTSSVYIYTSEEDAMNNRLAYGYITTIKIAWEE